MEEYHGERPITPSEIAKSAMNTVTYSIGFYKDPGYDMRLQIIDTNNEPQDIGLDEIVDFVVAENDDPRIINEINNSDPKHKFNIHLKGREKAAISVATVVAIGLSSYIITRKLKANKNKPQT